MLRVDEGADAAKLLRLSDNVVDERRLTGRFWPKELDDAAARHPADSKSEIERERPPKNLNKKLQNFGLKEEEKLKEMNSPEQSSNLNIEFKNEIVEQLSHDQMLELGIKSG